jgi:hypothetical protein
MMKQFSDDIATLYEIVLACHWVLKSFPRNIKGSVIRCNTLNKVHTLSINDNQLNNKL